MCGGVILNLLDEPYSLAAAGEAVKGFTEAEVAVSRLGRTLDELSLLRAGPISVTPDMSLVRDLSYYRGFVFEAFVPERAEWGSVCSGGRYDDVLGTGDRLMPGVGASIGTTRLFSLLQAEGLGMDYGQSPTQVAIVVDDWTRHSRDAHRIAADLRNHGTCVELVYGGSSLADLVGGAFRRGTTHVVRFVDDEVLVLDRSRKELRTSVEGATEQLTP
jgi:histidyl-tRNA synthetase